MKTFMRGLKELFSDKRGQLSSLRVVLFLSYILLVWLFIEWRYAFRLELLQDSPDYDGLTKLFLAMMVSFGVSLVAKVLQKKQEKEDDEWDEE